MKANEPEKAFSEASAKNSGRRGSCGGSVRRKVGLSVHIILSLLKLPVRLFIWAVEKLFNWSCDYDGFLALPVKAIPAVMFVIAIFTPFFLAPWFIYAGLTLGVPGCYAVYALFWTMFVLCNFGAAVIGYIATR